MPLVLSAQNNPVYGGNLINQKYSPLENIVVDGAEDDYRALFDNRRNLLTGINAYPPNTLNFYGNFPVVVPAVAPMVVASSNRANWLQNVLQNAVTHGDFTGYLDHSTFNAGAKRVPVAWFSPLRSQRPLFIVVHWSEYDYYEARVGNNQYANVTVVGYKFTAAPPALDIVGFGASRYAALQLMMQLGYHQAWVVDDNVININGFPNTLAPVEALMMPLPGNIWGFGFGTPTANINVITGANVNFQNNNPVLAGTAPGLLQQVVLWNLDLLGPAHLNYSPLFVASNEDVSLSNYLQFTARDERIFTVCSIVKFEPFNDPGQGEDEPNAGASVEVAKRRNRLLAMLSGIEADTAIDPGSGQLELQAYVRDTVLVAANQPATTLHTAQARAIEQVLSAATRQGWFPAVPNNPFNPYNGAANIATLLPAAL